MSFISENHSLQRDGWRIDYIDQVFAVFQKMRKCPGVKTVVDCNLAWGHRQNTSSKPRFFIGNSDARSIAAAVPGKTGQFCVGERPCEIGKHLLELIVRDIQNNLTRLRVEIRGR